MQWRQLAKSLTNADGRVDTDTWFTGKLEPGMYRVTFDTGMFRVLAIDFMLALAGAYFANAKVTGFYPVAQVVFEIHQTQSHYHIPLLVSPFGFSTYRGS